MITAYSDLEREFNNYYGEGEPIKSYFAPGRVNLIGEHIDYNGGSVFPAALTIGITALIRKNNSNYIRLISLNAKGEVKINLQESIVYKEEDDWGNYPKGVFAFLLEEGHQLFGCDILFYSTLPEGAGLSSSAAIEVLTGYMMLHMTGVEKIDRVWLAKFSQRVENEFVKVNCGIMDQFSIAMGKENFAIQLDCKSLQYKYVALDLSNYDLMIMNTNKKRELADSKYNERRGECDEVLDIINKYEKTSSLCEATLEQVNKYIGNEILKKRARHVISENIRVERAISALLKKDFLSFASLMTESHNSLKYDYEVTGFELDTIVEEALKFNGCIGARMTGAGFGGCAIALVKSDSVELFIKQVGKAYKEKTNMEPAFYKSKIGDGVNQCFIKTTAN